MNCGQTDVRGGRLQDDVVVGCRCGSKVARLRVSEQRSKGHSETNKLCMHTCRGSGSYMYMYVCNIDRFSRF